MKLAKVLRIVTVGLSFGVLATPALGQQQQPGNGEEEQGNPFRPQEGEAATEPIDIDFDDVSLMDVIKSIGAQTGRNFEVDPSIANQRVTIVAHHPVPPDLAYEILEGILAPNFMLVETLDGNLIKVVPRQGSQNAEKFDMRVDEHLPLDGYDRFSIHVVNVQYADASEVAQLLKTVGSQASNIVVYQLTNTLVIIDTADGVRNMLRLLEEIDKPGFETSMEIFTLDYTRAEVLVEQINQVLGDTGQGPTQASTPRRTAPVRARPSVPGQDAPQEVGSREEVLRMVPDERLNALIVVASSPMMEQVRFLIEQLDTPTPYEANNMHYVELLNADAEAVEEALREITGGTPRQAQGGGGGGGGGGGASAEVQPFEKSVTITRYEQTNSLIIVASPQDFRKLQQMINNLDVPRRQVNTEAIVMEVTINDRFELSVETAALSGNDVFALNNVVNLANAIAGGPLSLTGPGATVGVIDGTTEITVPSGFDDQGNPTGTTVQTIPNVPLLLTALNTVTDVEVLSQPNILTVDNEEGNIQVGQEVPVLNSLTDVDPRSGFRSQGRISRERVGVLMTVTPQINEGDFVSMDVAVEVSQPVQSTVGIDPNEVGATFQISEIQSQVVVGNGQTGIIGGLLREGKDKTVNQMPILGDLPLLGWLFRNKVNSRNKQNLVVLLTPHIIKEGHDLSRITDFRVGEFYQSNVDVVLEDLSFIKKIKKKREIRNDYRPTDKFKPDEQVPEQFERGTIPR